MTEINFSVAHKSISPIPKAHSQVLLKIGQVARAKISIDIATKFETRNPGNAKLRSCNLDGAQL
jgi:hypothetical protein